MVVTRRDWLLAGQVLLRQGGVRAVKLRALTRKLGVTTGSFYHHFEDMPAYLDALAEHYGEAQPTEGLARLAGLPPRERLAGLVTMARAQDMQRLDAAMRGWAADDPRAAIAVRAADKRLFLFIEAAFRELGFPRAEAQARAYLMFAAGAAVVYPPWRVGDAARTRMLSLLTAASAVPMPSSSQVVGSSRKSA
jgi:AcrR family transcriptional regulator